MGKKFYKMYALFYAVHTVLLMFTDISFFKSHFMEITVKKRYLYSVFNPYTISVNTPPHPHTLLFTLNRTNMYIMFISGVSFTEDESLFHSMV